MNKHGHQASTCIQVALLLASMVLTACTATPIERVPPRSMNINAGPEKVFARPVPEFMPQLAGAELTSVNGRVGNELVFWEYRLNDNRRLTLFTCLPDEDVNCSSRITAICPNGGEEVVRQEEAGLVRQMYCVPVGNAHVGELYPNCQVNEKPLPLLVGLTQCR